ncbi:hypothetical protein F2Q69_00057237 [Brassica cretica]|uniref:Uncharacterized protein n=1 Tax=Brassica cretica TaxID=69181 RepID=A0A8S9N1Q2_BRACR|nr:hypothetical protein F2Q69_00057237 [Brassica cretica]
MLLLVRTPPRLTRSISRRGEELLKSQRSSFSSVSAFSTPSLLPPVRTRLSNVSGPAFLSVTKSPPSLPSKPEPPDLVPRDQLEHLFEALSPPDQPLEALSPPDLPLEARSPPEPPDPPDVPVVGNMILCWCVDWSSKCSFPSMIVIVVVAATLVSLSRPLIQVLSQRFSNLTLGDELISLVWYLELSCGLSLCLGLALVCSFTAVCSPFTALCSSTFVVLKSLYVQLWQLNGVMPHISIHHVNRVLLDSYCLVSSFMEVVPLPISSSTLCGFVAGSLMLKIRNTSNTEVLVKGFVAMLKIVDCALAVASILGVISLIVVSNFQGFVSLCSSMVVEIRGLLDVISCLSVLYAPIFLCCICFLVIAVCLAWMALFSCSINTLSMNGE